MIFLLIFKLLWVVRFFYILIVVPFCINGCLYVNHFHVVILLLLKKILFLNSYINLVIFLLEFYNGPILNFSLPCGAACTHLHAKLKRFVIAWVFIEKGNMQLLFLDEVFSFIISGFTHYILVEILDQNVFFYESKEWK